MIPVDNSTDLKSILPNNQLIGHKNEDGDEIQIRTRDDLDMLIDCFGETKPIDIYKISPAVIAPTKSNNNNPPTKVQRNTYNNHIGSVYSLDFNSDGTKFISVGKDAKAILYDLVGNKVLASHKIGRMLYTSFSPKDEQFLVASEEPAVILFEAKKNGKELQKYKKLHKERIFCSNYNPAGNMFVTASVDGSSKVADVVTKKIVAQYQGTNEIFSAQFITPHLVIYSPDKSPFSIDNYDIRTSGAAAPKLLSHTATVWSVNGSTNGHEVVSCGMDGQVLVFDIRTGKKRLGVSVSTLSCHHATFFGSTDQYIISCGRDSESFVIWDSTSGKKLFSEKTGSIYRVCKNGRQTLSASFSGNIERAVWGNI